MKSSPSNKLIRLPFSIDSILAKDNNQTTQNSTPTFSLSGSFSSTNTSSESPTSPTLQMQSETRLAQLESVTKKRVKVEHDSASTGSPDSKLLNTPDKSAERFSGEFSPLWNDFLARHLRFQQQPDISKVNCPPVYTGFCESHLGAGGNEAISNYLVVNKSSPSELVKSLCASPMEFGAKLTSSPQQSSSTHSMGRSPRVPFSRHQVMVLESKFRKTHYLSSLEVTELANQLHLTETRVKIWFQNRRARERRENALNNLSSPMEHSPSNLDTQLVPVSDSFNGSVSPMVASQSPTNISQWTPLLLQACLAAQNQFTDSESKGPGHFPDQDPPILKLGSDFKMT